ncbi:MAG TPA: phospholipid carrier-dependent glycosyltransferase [Trebonia sp.]|jgi:dolichyl-phosphate-mannose--protein O-mannosyl transferase
MTATHAGPPARDPEDGGPVGADTDQIAIGPPQDAISVRTAPDARAAERIAALRARLMSPMPEDRPWGWLGPLLVTAFAAFFRFNRLSVPHAVVFDETYYAKDAWSILLHGVEWQYVKNADSLIIAGNTGHLFKACTGTGCGEYVVQPPVGKLLIAVGEWIYGLTPLGWRLAPAIIGTLAVLVMCRVVRRLTRSTLLGCVAGLLLSLDGLEFVLSRTGILDIFLMFFVLAAFGCLLVDRDVSRARLASAMVLEPGDEAGPQLGIRKWRVAAGVLIGLACASKQDAAWYVLAFIGLAIAWDIGARRAAGLRQAVRGALVRDGKWLPVTLLVIPVVTYIATWSGWLIAGTGFDRNYAQQNGVHVPVISALYSLFDYHRQMLQFATHLSLRHPYQSQPWDWYVISRPVAFYYQCFTDQAGTHTCPPKYSGQQWSSEVLAIGNPAIWWVGTVAILFCLGWWFTRRDWRAGVAVLGVAAGWVTWLPFPARTKFYYYALEFEPFMIMCIVLCLGLIIGPVAASLRRRAIGSTLAGIYVLAVLVLFWYFYPILAAKIIPYSSWLSHMWYTGWI